MSQNEIDAATQVHVEELNTQEQQRITWPATSAVALAYVDQLTRSSSIRPDRVRAVKAALDKNDATQLDTLAAQIDRDGGSAKGRDAQRLKALAAGRGGDGAEGAG